MTHRKFSLTSQCHKTTILHIVFQTKKGNWPGIVQEPISAEGRLSRKLAY